ncbi:MAG: T9SS type A sorting domain-containing protein [Bacteroidia bacterium]
MNVKNGILSTMLLLSITISLQAQDLGDLDQNFGSDGFVYTNYETDSAEYLSDVLVLKSSKILLGGHILQKGGDDLLVSRLNKNGAIDLNFGVKGYWTYDINDKSGDRITAMLELADKKIIVVGSTAKNGKTFGFIMRLNANGSLDMSYGEGSKGYTLFNAGSHKSCRPADVEIYQNSIYIAATVWTDDNNYDMGIFKFSASGALVNSFASSGSNVVHLKGSEEVSSLDIGSDGSFIIGGTSTKSGDQYGAILKLNQFGLKTSAFDGAGYLVYNHGGDVNTIMDVAYDSKGRIVAIGSEGTNPDINGIIFRFDKNGLPDDEFGTNGKIQSDIGSANGVYLNSLNVDENDHILCSGYLFGQSYRDIYVLKLTDQGKAHPDFGTKGDVNYPLDLTPNYLHFKATSMQSNGSIILAGTTTISGYDAFNITVGRIHHWQDAATANTLSLNINTFQVWPNPAKDIVHIQTNGKVLKSIQLVDLQGRIIQNWNADSGEQSFPLSAEIQGGSYLIRFILDNALYTQRIVIQ